MMDSVSYARLIGEYIQTGGFSAEKPVKAPEIAVKFKLHPSFVRGCVNTARCMGIPICSNGAGYWYSLKEEEVRATIEHIEDRIQKQQHAVSGLKASIGG